jgi:HKD family nuclease
MAEVKLLFQGLIEKQNHSDEVNNLLQKKANQFIVSTAYLNSSGVTEIDNSLQKINKNVDFFVGIRNGVTSIQAIIKLIQMDIFPYIVDTATQKKIFHPKIYASFADNHAEVIIGSANLTSRGFNRNLEASTFMYLDKSNKSDEIFIEDTLCTFNKLKSDFPKNVLKVTSIKQAVKLMQQGRLADERDSKYYFADASKARQGFSDLKPIDTFDYSKKRKRSSNKLTSNKIPNNSNALVWTSRPLKRRSLNIPDRDNSNNTGNINLGAGAMRGIEFQTYFRDIVFSKLVWGKDNQSKYPHLDRASINAELMIAGISYGQFALEVTHNHDLTKSSKQKNTRTAIKWGEAISLIKNENLLGRTLKIYDRGSPNFLVSID